MVSTWMPSTQLSLLETAVRDGVADLWSRRNGSFLTREYIDQFEFIPGKTWLSTWWTPIIIVPIYLFSVAAVKAHVKRRGKPYDLNNVVILHNALLSIGSLALFIALSTTLIQMIQDSSFFSVYCDVEIRWARGRHYFLYYLNYLFKFIELGDTILLAARAKPTPFLHTYHHSATLVLCWSQLRAQSCLQWVVIDINLLIHVWMYLYYALHALGIDVWWKRYLTAGQITQFVVAVTACWGGLLPRTLHSLGYKSWPRCHGQFMEAFFGVGILSSYLFLFVQLYKQNYKDSKGGSKRAKQTHED
jgi:hypothetical protein